MISVGAGHDKVRNARPRRIARNCARGQRVPSPQWMGREICRYPRGSVATSPRREVRPPCGLQGRVCPYRLISETPIVNGLRSSPPARHQSPRGKFASVTDASRSGLYIRRSQTRGCRCTLTYPFAKTRPKKRRSIQVDRFHGTSASYLPTVWSDRLEKRRSLICRPPGTKVWKRAAYRAAST